MQIGHDNKWAPWIVGGLAIIAGGWGLWSANSETKPKKKEKTSKTPGKETKRKQTSNEEEEEKKTPIGSEVTETEVEGEPSLIVGDPDFTFRGSLIRQLSETTIPTEDIRLEDENVEGVLDFDELQNLMRQSSQGPRNGGTVEAVDDELDVKESKETLEVYTSTMAPFSITHPADWIRDESKNPLEAEGDVVWKTPEGVEILSVHWCENPPEHEKILKTMSSKKIFDDQYNQLSRIQVKQLANPQTSPNGLYYAPLEHSSPSGDGLEKKGYFGVLLAEDCRYHFIVWYHPDKDSYKHSPELESLGKTIFLSFKYLKKK